MTTTPDPRILELLKKIDRKLGRLDRKSQQAVIDLRTVNALASTSLAYRHHRSP